MQPYTVDDLYIDSHIEKTIRAIISHIKILITHESIKVYKIYMFCGYNIENESEVETYFFTRIFDSTKRMLNLAKFAKIIKNKEYYLLTGQNRRKAIKYNISEGDYIFDHDYRDITSEIVSGHGNEDFLHKIHFSYISKRIKI